MAIEPEKRFDGRAVDYAKYRPGYPSEVVDIIAAAADGGIVADIGAGTGMLTKPLLERGLDVIAIEPNGDMRGAAERELGGFQRFRSIDASAENTGLTDSSVDVITVATAFHWFDHELCKAEFRRILKHGGTVFILQNRYDAKAGFSREANIAAQQLRGANPAEHAHKRNAAAYEAFFDGNYRISEYFWSRELTFEQLLGLELSRSTSPDAQHPNFELLCDVLRELFEKYAQNGTVTYNYRTELVRGEW